MAKRKHQSQIHVRRLNKFHSCQKMQKPLGGSTKTSHHFFKTFNSNQTLSVHPFIHPIAQHLAAVEMAWRSLGPQLVRCPKKPASRGGSLP